MSSVARWGHSECLLSVPAPSDAGVDALVERAQRAGAEIVTGPAASRGGHTGAFADPDGHLWMVTSPPRG